MARKFKGLLDRIAAYVTEPTKRRENALLKTLAPLGFDVSYRNDIPMLGACIEMLADDEEPTDEIITEAVDMVKFYGLTFDAEIITVDEVGYWLFREVAGDGFPCELEDYFDAERCGQDFLDDHAGEAALTQFGFICKNY